MTLTQKLGIKFRHQQLLKQALTHRSFLNESKGEKRQSNERLEFLGDAILDFCVSHWLYQQFPGFSEGNLTNLRSNLVNTDSLARIARQAELGKYIQLSKGERDSGGQENTSLLADTTEAVIGALFLDQGLPATATFIKKQLDTLLLEILARGELKDYKSLLQESVQSRAGQPPIYKVISEQGPDHAKTFTVAVFNQKNKLASASGRSKQKAEQSAAQLALEKLTVKK